MTGHERARNFLMIRVTAVLLGVAFLHVTAWPTGSGLAVFCAQLALLGTEMVLAGLGARLSWRMYQYESGKTKQQPAFQRLINEASRWLDIWPPRR